jgi:V8-like Glu-specific endopeptidase
MSRRPGANRGALIFKNHKAIEVRGFQLGPCRRGRVFLLVILVSLLPLVACGGEAPVARFVDEPSSEERGIAFGSPDSGHPAVGEIVFKNGGCSSTLIGRKTLLTAGHCTGEGAPKSFKMGTKAYTVSSVVTHPDFNWTYGDVPDIGLVFLTEKVLGITPALLSKDPPSMGEQITLVGYGFTETNQIDVKYSGSNVISGIGQYSFTFWTKTGAQVCSGDSGGPSFATVSGKETLIGVHSSTTGSCGASYGEGWDIRTDALYDWIAKEAGSDLYTGGSIDVTAPTVSIKSPEDGGKVTESTLEVEVSATDDVGVVKVVLEEDQKQVGALTAAPYTFDLADQKSGTHTLEATAYDAEGNSASSTITVMIDLRQPFGEACSANSDCKSGICSSGGFCTASCSSDNPCPDSYECVSSTCAVAAKGGGCSAAPRSPTGETASGLVVLLVLLCGALGRRTRRAR